MSDALDDLRNQATTWYLSLDERTRTVFEAVYAEAPGVVVRAPGGAQVGEAELGQHTSLASVLDAADGNTETVVPYIAVEGGVRLTPRAPTDVQALHVSWTDCNYGAGTDAYVDRIAVINAANELLTDDGVDSTANPRMSPSTAAQRRMRRKTTRARTCST